MVLKTSLDGIIKPPPVMPQLSSPTAVTSLTSQALQQSLYQKIPTAATASVPARMSRVAFHPCQPWVTYLLEPETSSGKLSSQRLIVVQNVETAKVIWKISLSDLVSILCDLDRRAPNHASKQTTALRNLGTIQSLSFFDTSTLHVTGMLSNVERRFTSLLVQFTAGTIILNLRQGPNSFAIHPNLRVEQSPTATRLAPFIPIQFQLTESSLKAQPTTNVIPLTQQLLLVGCADGTLRVLDMWADRLIKTGKVPGDAPLSMLLVANLYNVHQPAQKQLQRIISVSKKGTAYLWEFVLSEGNLIDIRLPLCKMEGVIDHDAAASATDWEHSTSMIDFDAHRQLFLWWIPSKSKLMYWDLKETSQLKRKKTTVPKQEPYLVSMPSSESSSSTFLGAWLHPAFSSSTLVCAALNSNSELTISVVNMETECRPGKPVKATVWMTCHIPTLIQRDVGTIALPILKPLFITTHRRLGTSSVLVGTDLGLVRVSFPCEIGYGSLHAHLGSAHGSEWGKSCIWVNHSQVQWAPLELEGTKNPNGLIPLSTKHQQTIFHSRTSSPTVKKSVRLPPRFIPSPSGNYVCMFWQYEKRYEILHLASSLQKGQEASVYAPAVASGESVLSFAWVGDDDVFMLLISSTESREGDASSASVDASSAQSSSSTAGSRGIGNLRKQFNIGRKTGNTISGADTRTNSTDGSRFMPRLEAKMLVSVSANAAEMGSIAAATARGIGEIQLRGGNRNPPTTLFGGPVLCVACKDRGSDGGSSMFYTCKPETEERTAANFISSGPTLPYPDFVEWDDDGKLCAVVVQGLVAVYLSNDPQFILLGNVQLGAPMERNVIVTSLKFVHGVLYCTTKTTVQCIFLGDIEHDSICHLDTFVLASASGPPLASKSFSLTPPTIPMTLNHPTILGYQSGSLLVSTVVGVYAVRLDHPLLRIGCLIAAGLPSRAKLWLDSIPSQDHEALAAFLDRRGAADLAASLSGLSLEALVDLSLRHGLTQRLVELLKLYGVRGLRQIDLGRGVSVGILGPEEHDHSVTVCVGAYLLSEGKSDMVKEMAMECLKMGDTAGTKEAFLLSSLLLAVDPAPARQILETSVGEKRETDDIMLQAEEPEFVFSNDYPVNSLVRDHVL